MKKMRIISAAAAVTATAALLAVGASAYNGYIGFQTTPYSFRNDWTETNYGKSTDYFNKFIVWGNNDPETFPDYEDNFDYDISGYVLDANYTDATIDADGTYTVTAEDIDWALDGATDFNLIFVSTDIPNDGTVKATEAKIIVDGEVVKTVTDPICDETNANFNISLANVWNSDIGSYGLAFPTKSLAIEFTIEGLGGGAAEEAAAEETTVEETAAPETEAPATEAPAETEAAPATEAAVDAAAEAAPAAGDTNQAAASGKGSPDTGIEDVAVVGGLALLAGAGIVLSRKRK